MFAGVILSTAPPLWERGISKAAAIGHIVPWTILVLHILFVRPEGISPRFDTYLTILGLVNGISLAFDCVDAYKWITGDRTVVRPAG